MRTASLARPPSWEGGKKGFLQLCQLICFDFGKGPARPQPRTLCLIGAGRSRESPASSSRGPFELLQGGGDDEQQTNRL